MRDMTQSGAPVRAGDLLAGKYRVERVLGTGGMGIVVAARHEQLGQRVAIKFVRDEAIASEEAVARFLFEARAVVKLRSEHVAKVIDVGTLDSGAPYMVMEFLEGSDLGTVLEERGALPVAMAVENVVQACEALAEAHAAGIVHRDIKPHNLFLAQAVGGATKIKVLDFGVSKAVSGAAIGALTTTSTMIGSPLYMSPEQMRSSRDVDARADVWALGVVLFELLAEATPFEADTIPELCLKVVSDPPRSLAALRPELPQQLVAVVRRCLEKNPRKRYANAAELAAALQPFTPASSQAVIERARRAVAGEVVTLTSRSELVRAKRVSRRLAAPWAVAGVGAAVLAAAAVGSLFRPRPGGAGDVPSVTAAAALPGASAVFAQAPSPEAFIPAVSPSAAAAPVEPPVAKEPARPTRRVTARAQSTNVATAAVQSGSSNPSGSDDDIPALR
jgi:serine/threonine-protein kinase